MSRSVPFVQWKWRGRRVGLDKEELLVVVEAGARLWLAAQTWALEAARVDILLFNIFGVCWGYPQAGDPGLGHARQMPAAPWISWRGLVQDGVRWETALGDW